MGLFVLACAAALGASAHGPLASQLELLNTDPALHRASLGIAVESLSSGAVLYRRQADKLFIPASTMKLVTAAAALKVLGPSFTFRTTIESAAQPVDGELHGNLYLVGGGDPNLGVDDPLAVFETWAQRLRDQGLREVHGDLVVDDSLIADGPWGDGWTWDDFAWDYAAPVSALTVARNSVAVTVTPGKTAGAPAILHTAWPECVDLDDAVVTVAAAAGHDHQAPVAAINAELTRAHAIRLVGSIPQNAAPVTEDLAIVQPAECAGRLLRAALATQGILVTGTIRHGRRPQGSATTVLLTHDSEPLSDILHFMLLHSHNLTAELVARQLAPATSGKTFAAAKPVLKTLLRDAGVPNDAYRLRDGSGLSRYDLLAPEVLVRLLRYSQAHSWGAVLQSLLPVSGDSGTMASRTLGGPAVGHVQAKTGSMTGIFALAGLVHARDGETLVFSMSSNSVAQPRQVVQRIQDQVLEVLTTFGHGHRVARGSRLSVK